MDEFDKLPDVHVRVLNRGNRKVTTVEGLEADLDLKRIASSISSLLGTGNTIDNSVIQFNGDVRQQLKKFLTDEGIVDAKYIKIHGY